MVLPEPRPEPQAPETVNVSFEGPGPQPRLTIAFRIILAVPHFVYAYILGVVGSLAVIVGWFAALILGRLPEGLATYIARVVQYVARVNGYAVLLLTDRYPPFSLTATDYAVSVDVTPTRLNRAAVFFRFILLIPGLIVLSVVGGGLAIASIVIWLIVLIRGRLPAPLFDAEAAVLRYQVRFYAYAALLTGEYPRGLFGDGPAVAEPDGPTPLPARPRITRLVLSSAGRRLVILFIVLGAVIGVGGTVATAATAARTASTSAKLDDYHDELATAVQKFGTDAQSCAVSSGGAECVHSAAVRLADSFARFDRQVASLSFPAGAADTATRLEGDAREVVASLRKLATINSLTEYQTAATEFQNLASRFDQDYQKLASVLS